MALALYDSWPEGRSLAIEVLKRRDPRDFMDELVGFMHRPFSFHIQSGGTQGEAASLIIDGDQRQIQRLYRPMARTMTGRRLTGYRPVAAGGRMPAIGSTGPASINRFLPESPTNRLVGNSFLNQGADGVLMQARDVTDQAVQRDLAIVEAFNARIRAENQIVGETLTRITGQTMGTDPDVWRTWWNDKLGLRYERTEARYKETTVQNVPVRFTVHHSCFAAGTPVETVIGPRPIESLKLGDVVLSQDTVTGALDYQPILGVHHNRPAETVRIRLKDEMVVSTPVHRFWRPGRGWAMARDLSPGDSIRTVGGRAEIVEIRPDALQPVFNLDVARNHSFFVGSGKLLVRDNSLPPPMSTPFDAEPVLSAIGEEPTGPSQERDAEIQPSPADKDAMEPGSIWGSPAASSGPREASDPGPRTGEPGSIWGSPAASSGPHKTSMLGPRPVEPTGREPR